MACSEWFRYCIGPVVKRRRPPSPLRAQGCDSPRRKSEAQAVAYSVVPVGQIRQVTLDLLHADVVLSTGDSQISMTGLRIIFL